MVTDVKKLSLSSSSLLHDTVEMEKLLTGKTVTVEMGLRIVVFQMQTSQDVQMDIMERDV